MSLLKKVGSVGAIVAFLNSPTGKKVVGKAKEIVTDPKNQQKAADFANKLRKQPPVQDRPEPTQS
ncbi:MAG: hypothetical protein ABJD68_05120 [Nakamurella sp.]